MCCNLMLFILLKGAKVKHYTRVLKLSNVIHMLRGVLVPLHGLMTFILPVGWGGIKGRVQRRRNWNDINKIMPPKYAKYIPKLHKYHM